jgi:hypothetical protein
MKRDTRSTRRGDRLALTLIGTLLTAGAVLALLVATGAIERLGPYVDGDDALFNSRLATALDDHQIWWQLGTVVVGVLLLILGLVWLRHQLPAGRQLRDTTLDVHDDTPGDTVVDGRAFANAFEADVRRHPDVLDARADMLLDRNLVRLRLTAADDTELERLLGEAVRPAIARLATVAGLPTQPASETDVRLRPREGRSLQ